MDLRITIDLTRGCLKYLGLDAFYQSQHIDRSMDAGLGGLNRVKLVVDRRCRTGQVADLIALHVQRIRNVVTH